MGVHIWGSKDAVIAGSLVVAGGISATSFSGASIALTDFLSVSTSGAAVAATGQIRLGATASMRAMVGAGTVPVFDVGGGACLFGSSSWAGGVYVDGDNATGLFFRSAKHAFFSLATAVVKPTITGTVITATCGTATADAMTDLQTLGLFTDSHTNA